MTLNAAEQFLLERLPVALRLERSMKAIRDQYESLWETICDSTHPELNYRGLHTTDGRAQVGFGKQSWVSINAGWPSGFYLSGIGIENLCHDDEVPPQLGIWIKPPKSLGIDLDAARECVLQQAQRVLGTVHEEPLASEISLWSELPETRQQLLRALTQNDGQEFVRIMASHLRSIGPLIPVLDRVFDQGARRAK